MDGKTTPISIAATMAADKGIIVVNSAGNSGNSSWHYIGAPADASNIITVGAVDENKNFANFSSYGPSFDGRVKPTLMAQGKNTIVATSDNKVITGNGTSFSSPVTAGMLACLWGSNAEKSNLEIMDAVIKSCDRYLNPDDQFGYGIPDYYEALKACSDNLNFYISGEYFNFRSSQEEKVDFSVYSIEGKLVSKGSFYSPFYWVDIKPKSEGIYVVYFQFKGEEFTSKFIVLE
jgi:subtilisin family serine protease